MSANFGSGLRNIAVAAALSLVLVASACKAKEGDTGPAGPPGAPSTPPPTDTTLTKFEDAPGLHIVIVSLSGGSGTGGTFQAGDTITVNFTVKKTDGENLPLSELDNSDIYVSGPTFNYQRVIKSSKPGTDWRLSATQNADGSWTYAFPTPIPATYQAPYNDTISFGSGDGELAGQALVSGTYTVGMQAYKFYTVDGVQIRDAGAALKDFLLGGAGTIEAREVVKDDNCNKCHLRVEAHGGGRRGVGLCLLCHTSGSEDGNTSTVLGGTPGVSIDFRVMIHKIHNGSHLPSVNGVTTKADGTRLYSSFATGQVGDGTTTNFVFTLSTPPEPNGLTLSFTNAGPVTFTVTDDGSGKLVGDVGTGTNTVNYTTGAVDVTFSTAPGAAVPINAGYAKKYEMLGRNDSVADFSDVGFPVWPSLSTAMPRDEGYSALTAANKTTNDTIRKGVVACEKCHGDPDGTGTLTAPAQGDLAFAQPTRRACGACHDDVVWSRPYTKNSATMPAQADDSSCALCHPTTGTSIASQDAHKHPVMNPAVNPGLNFNVTAVTPGHTGNFAAGDYAEVTFSVKNDSGTDVAVGDLDSGTVTLLGPTNNRQVVLPYSGPSSIQFSPFDFAGRLAASSTSNKGSMSKANVAGALESETLTVQFSSATAYTVVGSTSLALGDSATPPNLPLANGTNTNNPSGMSLSAVVLSSTAVPQQILVQFTNATDFTVTGSVSGSMGTGFLPASTSASMRFTSGDGTVAFTLTVGTTAITVFPANIYMVVFKGSAANPVLFALVAGRTAAFANGDRFYYDIQKPAATYTRRIPMDLVLEYLGNVGGLANASNVPVYYGRQTVYEVTAVALVPPGATTLAANAPRFARFVTVGSTTGFAPDDYVVVDNAAGIGTREYLRINSVDAINSRLWFYTPLRYEHLAATTVNRATLTYRQEGVNYTLTPGTGTVTPIAGFTPGNAVVMNYRTDGLFGYKRDSTDTSQTVYQAAIIDQFNDAGDFGQSWGKWSGLAYLDGTYTVSMWGYKTLYVTLNNETQTYRNTSPASEVDFLYGTTAEDIVPHELITPSSTCDDCHDRVLFHGGGRRGLVSCVTCHSIAGSTAGPDEPIDFRTMLHAAHRGESLVNASAFFGGRWADVVFPAWPGETRHCTVCHGTNESWKEPADRTHPAQTTPTRKWRSVCIGCHDSTAAMAHFNLNTFFGVESCDVCHGPGKEESVEVMHKTR